MSSSDLMANSGGNRSNFERARLICVTRSDCSQLSRSLIRQRTLATDPARTGNMGSEPINPNTPGRMSPGPNPATEPELRLLIADKSFEEPLYKSLFRGLDEFFFPKKLPPLKLESKPEPVKDIWGFYSNWKAGALGVAGYYALLTVAVVLAVFIAHRIVNAAPTQKVTVTLVDPGDLPALKPSKTQVGGGGGGGDRDVLAGQQRQTARSSRWSRSPLRRWYAQRPSQAGGRADHRDSSAGRSWLRITCRTWAIPWRTQYCRQTARASGGGIGSGERRRRRKGQGPALARVKAAVPAEAFSTSVAASARHGAIYQRRSRSFPKKPARPSTRAFAPSA